MPQNASKGASSGLGDFFGQVGDILGVVNRSVVRQGPRAGSISITGLLGNIANEPERKKEAKLTADLREAKLKRTQQEIQAGQLDVRTAQAQLNNFDAATGALQGQADNPALVGALNSSGRSDVAENAIVQAQNIRANSAKLAEENIARAALAEFKQKKSIELAKERGKIEHDKIKFQGKVTRRNQRARLRGERKAKEISPPTLTEIKDVRTTVGNNLSSRLGRGVDEKGNQLIARADLPVIRAASDVAVGLMRDGVPRELAIAAAEDSVNATSGGARFKFPRLEEANTGFFGKLLRNTEAGKTVEFLRGLGKDGRGLSDQERGVLVSVNQAVTTQVAMAGHPRTRDMAVPIATQDDMRNILDMVIAGLQEAGFDVRLGSNGIEGDPATISKGFIKGIERAIVNAFPDKVAEPVRNK